MGQYLDLIRQLGLDDPEAWKPPPPPPAPAPVPDFRATNQFDPMTGQPVVTALPEVTPEPLTGWRQTADQTLNAVVGTVKGATGMGDQGPAGPSWTNFGALAAAVPLSVPEAFLGAIAKKLPRFAAALQAYRAPTEAGQLAAPFYSRLDEAAAALPGKFGAGALTKGGASAEELAIRQVPEFLAAQGSRPIPKAALTEHLAAHPVPGLEVKTLGTSANPYDAFVMRMEEKYGPGYDMSTLLPSEAQEQARLWERSQTRTRGMTENRTKFSQYQLPGGTHYRETLITLPEPAAAVGPIREAEANLATAEAALRDYRTANPEAEFLGLADPGYRTHVLARNEAGTALSRARAPMIEQRFKSSHFDEPNILAHTRSNERTIPGLGTGTFLEEVQSDWHQAGKEKGYGVLPPEPIDTTGWTATQPTGHRWHVTDEQGVLQNYVLPGDPAGGGARTAEQAIAEVARREQVLRASSEARVPDAPFKETWPDLALKHHLAEAAQNPETQWIGFSSGDTQTQRWGTERLTWTPAPEGGYAVTFEPQVAGNALGGDLGADALAAGHIRNETRVVRTEDDLKALLGGSEVKAGKAWKRITGTPEGGAYLPRKEGMEAFYDTALPAKLEKIVKPYGGTVDRVPLGGRPERLIEADMDAERRAYRALGGRDAGDAATRAFSERMDALKTELADAVDADAWILRLTPELKQRILRYGLPLLTGVAAVEAGTQAEPAAAGVD